MRKLLYLYQRAFFYVAQAKTEALKPLGFWNETLSILTWLAVSIDFRPDMKQIIGVYLLVIGLAIVFGKIITAIGVAKYNQKILNEQNPEIMAILAEIREVKELLKQNGTR